MNQYQKIFEAFNKAEVQYLIVGGVAVNLYGYSRFTGDVDILLSLDKVNLGKIDALTTKLGYVPRLPVNVKELGDSQKLKQFIDEKGLKAYTFISETHPQLDIDIIIDESISFKNFFRKKAIINIWNIDVPVIHINDLIGMKKKSGREKDLLDIKALLKLKNL